MAKLRKSLFQAKTTLPCPARKAIEKEFSFDFGPISSTCANYVEKGFGF
jgi:hypothetical protein